MTLLWSALRFYRQHLARFYLLRLAKAVALFGYRLAYRLASRIARRPEAGVYKWCAVSKVGGAFVSAKQTVLQGEAVQILSPRFLGYSAVQAAEATPLRTLDGPEMTVYEFSPAVAIGGIDAVFAGGQAIHHDLFLPENHRSPAENVGVMSYRPGGDALHLYVTKRAAHVNRAASLIGQCSSNYAHWLTETLPKLPILDSSGADPHWPLLIDAGLHPNILGSIALLNKNQRQIIEVDRWRPIQLNGLQVVSAPGYERYVPQGIGTAEPAAYLNVFSRGALRLLRTSVADAIAAGPRPAARRIYFSRTGASGNLRALENAAEIGIILEHYGIKTIIPESMSFQDQVATCLNAELIVAPIGAALANMIFAPAGCRVVILSPNYEGANYSYYTNLAGVLGHDLTYVLGQQTESRRHPMHRNYRIDVKDIYAALG